MRDILKGIAKLLVAMPIVVGFCSAIYIAFSAHWIAGTLFSMMVVGGILGIVTDEL